MIPKFEDFLYPFLKIASEGGYNNKRIKQEIIRYFHLTNEDLSAKTSGSSLLIVDSRCQWSLQYLRRAKMINARAKGDEGIYVVSERGHQYLNTHTSLTKKDLLEFPEYYEFLHGSSKQISKTLLETTETTPIEVLEDAYNTINSTLIGELLDMVLQQSPKFFERLVVDLLRAMGYGGSEADSAMVTQYTKDDGIDGIIKEDKLGLGKIYIQAKRWSNVVSKPEVQKFIGALDEQKASKGVFITTSHFSKEAIELPCKASKKIVLIDGEQLARYMTEYNVGVSVKRVYEVKRIDNDYFEE